MEASADKCHQIFVSVGGCLWLCVCVLCMRVCNRYVCVVHAWVTPAIDVLNKKEKPQVKNQRATTNSTQVKWK